MNTGQSVFPAMISLAVAATLSHAASHPRSAPRADPATAIKAECRSLLDKKRYLESRMRAGYRVKRGEILREKYRQISGRIEELECRSN